MSRSALKIFQDEDPVGYQVLVTASQMTRSPKITDIQRACLYAEIADAISPYMIKAAAESLKESENAKPKYIWRNGARVRV